MQRLINDEALEAATQAKNPAHPHPAGASAGQAGL